MTARTSWYPAAFAVLLALPIQPDLRATEVAGSIDVPTLWTAASSPYVVTGPLTVAAGATLTLEPGVTVRVSQYNGIWIRGHLQAVGTDAQPITIEGTSPTPGWWRGLQVVDAGSAQIEHGVVAHAGYWDQVGILAASTGPLVLQHTVLTQHTGDALRLRESYALLTSAHNTFRDSGRGVRLGLGSSWDDATSRFAGNGVDLHVDGGTFTGPVVWALNPAYSFFLSGSITLAETAHLTVRAGSVLKFAQYAGLWTDGRLDFEGTADAPVILTDWRDDSAGGDANRDATESAPAPGWWRGVGVRGSGQASLTHGALRYSGYWDSTGLTKSGTGSLVIDHWTFSHVAGHGLRLENHSGDAQVTDSIFATNSLSGLYLAAARIDATRCTFSGNSHYGILQEATDGLLYASQTFLGNAAGSVGVNPGSLDPSRHWSLGQGPEFTIVLLGSLSVPTHTTLTLDPGVRVLVGQYHAIRVAGTLHAVGTPDLPIRILGTSPEPGWWRGLQVIDSGSARIEYGEIAHSGYWDSVGVLASSTGPLVLRNSILHHHTGDALRLRENYSLLTASSNLFQHSQRGVRLGLGATWDDPTSDFQSNGVDVQVDAGSFTSNTVWALKPAYSFYLNGGITVADGARLTVRAGSVLKFAQYAGLWIDGQLDLLGSDHLPVIATDWRDDTAGGDANHDAAESAPDPGWWRGIFVRGTASATLTHGALRYSGYWDSTGLTKSGGGPLSIENWTFSHTGGHGLRLEESSGATQLTQVISRNNRASGLYLRSAVVSATSCRFEENADFGILQEAADGLDYAAQSFSGNGSAAIGVNGGSLSSDRRWSRGTGDPFQILVRGALTVPAGVRLTLDPGVGVRFAQYIPLIIEGTLSAIGTPALPIRFEGTTPQPGWWRGIHVTPSGSAEIASAVLSHSGYWDSVGLLKSGSGNLALRQVSLRANSGDGLRLDGSTGSHLIEGCEFSENKTGLFARNLASPVLLVSSRIEANSTWGVRNDGPAEIDARQSWWGHASGPNHSRLNPGGQGNPVSDLVLFDPWNSEASDPTSLVVVLEPAEARTAGARWSIDGQSWLESGAALVLQPGIVTLQCRTISGWNAPVSRAIEIVSQLPTSITLTYSQPVNPDTDAVFTPGPTLAQARLGHHFTHLPDGRVVLLGGHGAGFTALNSAEVWSPQLDSVTSVTMHFTHDIAAFAALADGRFLIAGGSANLGIPQYATSEIFDPGSASFLAVGNLVRFRSGSGAATLADGRVLVAGAWWTHNDAHTFGELFSPVTSTFQETGPLHHPRSHPWIVPGLHGGALVLGGSAVTGGSFVTPVERFDSATRSFSVVQTELFPDEPGWGLTTDGRAVAAQRTPSGSYLLLAQRPIQGVTHYRLFTVDPDNDSITPLETSPAVPDSTTHFLWTPIVDTARNRAYLLAQQAGASSPTVQLLTVDLATRSLATSASSHTLDPVYYLSGVGLSLLADGRILVSGGSADGSNFHPVDRTLLITPGAAAPQRPVLHASRSEDLRSLVLEWTGQASEWILEGTSDLVSWTPTTEHQEMLDGTVRIRITTDAQVRLFRLRRATSTAVP